VNVERVTRRRRRAFAPQFLGEMVVRDTLVRVEEQRGEQRALFPTAERDNPIAIPDRKRSEYAELDRRCP
jgi:hypothetical protein